MKCKISWNMAYVIMFVADVLVLYRRQAITTTAMAQQ